MIFTCVRFFKVCFLHNKNGFLFFVVKSGYEQTLIGRGKVRRMGWAKGLGLGAIVVEFKM